MSEIHTTTVDLPPVACIPMTVLLLETIETNTISLEEMKTTFALLLEVISARSEMRSCILLKLQLNENFPNPTTLESEGVSDRRINHESMVTSNHLQMYSHANSKKRFLMVKTTLHIVWNVRGENRGRKKFDESR